jgi:zinc/manganese transport system permease protein
MDVIRLMLAPTAECLVLVGIHSYLGIHVIRRGVIFIDLALAQIAALGTTVGLLLGLMPDTTASFVFSVIFTFLGAAVFAASRFKREKIPQEAIIGIVYALAAAVAILVMDRAPSGAEHLKEILVGRIVWVRWSEVISAAVAYAIVGGVHFFLRDRFMLISLDPQEAYRRGMNVRLWDFIFYLTFGFVISYSVSVAGVLLVFIFLVVPAVTAILITDRLLYQLLIGWAMGTVVTVGGMVLSYFLNLPGGPTIVAFYGVMLLVVVLPLYVLRSGNRARAAARVLAGAAVTAAVAAAMYLVGMGLGRSTLARSGSIEDVEHHHEEALHAGEEGEDGGARGEDEDVDVRFERAEALAVEGKKGEAMEILTAILSAEDTPLFYREKASALADKVAGTAFGYDPGGGPGGNAQPLAKMKAFLSEGAAP